MDKENQFEIIHFFFFISRDYMTLDRYTMERGIDFIPAIDVDSSVTTMADVEKLRPKIRQIYQCFDRPKFLHLGPKLTSLLFSSGMPFVLFYSMFSFWWFQN